MSSEAEPAELVDKAEDTEKQHVFAAPAPKPATGGSLLGLDRLAREKRAANQAKESAARKRTSMMEDDDLQDGNDDARDPGASTARGRHLWQSVQAPVPRPSRRDPEPPGRSERGDAPRDRRPQEGTTPRGQGRDREGGRGKVQGQGSQVKGRGSSIQIQGQGPGRIVRARGTTRRLPRRRQERTGGWILRERGLGPGLRRLRPGRRLRCEGRRRFRSDTVAGQSRHGGHTGSREEGPRG